MAKLRLKHTGHKQFVRSSAVIDLAWSRVWEARFWGCTCAIFPGVEMTIWPGLRYCCRSVGPLVVKADTLMSIPQPRVKLRTSACTCVSTLSLTLILGRQTCPAQPSPESQQAVMFLHLSKPCQSSRMIDDHHE